MLRLFPYLLLVLTWLAVGIVTLVVGAALTSLILVPHVAGGRYDAGEVETIIHEDILCKRMPQGELDAYLQATPLLLLLVGSGALFVAGQLLALTLRREHPGQAALGVGFGAFVVLLLLFVNYGLIGDPIERYADEARSVFPRQAALLENNELNTSEDESVSEEAAPKQVCVPRPHAEHLFYQITDEQNIDSVRRYLNLLAGVIAVLSIPLLFEPSTASQSVTQRLYRQRADSTCKRCGIVSTDGSQPSCVLCKHIFDLQMTIPPGRVFSVGEQVPVSITVTPRNNVPVRDVTVRLEPGRTLSYASHQPELLWQVPTARGRRVAAVVLEGPEVIASPRQLTVYLGVQPDVSRQLRRVKSYRVRVHVVGSEYSAVTESAEQDVLLQRAPLWVERTLGWTGRHVKSGGVWLWRRVIRRGTGIE